MRGFGSDNHAPVHPKIIESLIAVNHGHVPSYGTDPFSEKLTKKIEDLFGKGTEVYPVFNGTGANVVALRHLCHDTESILCSSISHINVDECGAPEKIAGVKLIPLDHKNGKLELSTLRSALIRRGDQHYSQIKAISLTQPTEYGTCYSLEELKQIIDWAKMEGLKVHIDGARLANAAHSLKVSFHELTFKLGVDVVSFGGTKNGLMMGELLLISPQTTSHRLKFLRKQSLQLPSKSRYLAAQFLTYFEDGIWQSIAENSCKMATLLADELAGLNLPELIITQPVDSNAVFVTIPKAWIKPLKEEVFFYVWDEHTFECRLMMSWDTEVTDIDRFILKIKQISSN